MFLSKVLKIVLILSLLFLISNMKVHWLLIILYTTLLRLAMPMDLKQIKYCSLAQEIAKVSRIRRATMVDNIWFSFNINFVSTHFSSYITAFPGSVIQMDWKALRSWISSIEDANLTLLSRDQLTNHRLLPTKVIGAFPWQSLLQCE